MKGTKKKQEAKETIFEAFVKRGGSGNQATNNILEEICNKIGL